MPNTPESQRDNDWQAQQQQNARRLEMNSSSRAIVEGALRRESLGSSAFFPNFTSAQQHFPFSTGMPPDIGTRFSLGASPNPFLLNSNRTSGPGAVFTSQDIASALSGGPGMNYPQSLPWSLGGPGSANTYLGLDKNVADDLYKIIQGANDMAAATAARNNLAALQQAASSHLHFKGADQTSVYLAAAQQQNLSQGMFTHHGYPPSNTATNLLVESALRQPDRCNLNNLFATSNPQNHHDMLTNAQSMYASLPAMQANSPPDLTFLNGALNGNSTHNGLLGDAVDQKPKTNADVQKSKQPVRALSAYNFFFREERNRIVNEFDGPYNCSESKKRELLAAHWNRDRSVKRRHRKTHGKIAFTELSRVISQRWRELPEQTKAFYKYVAAEDLIRYHREVDELKDQSGAPGSGAGNI